MNSTVGVVCYLFVSVFVCFVFLQGKLNECECMHYHDFHSFLERSLGKRESRGSTEKAKKDRQTPAEEQTLVSGVQGKHQKPSSSHLPPGRVTEDLPFIFFQLSAPFIKAL